jgi:hypothetical protein
MNFGTTNYRRGFYIAKPAAKLPALKTTQEVTMLRILPIIALTALAGCASTPASTNPPPSDEFTAVANFHNAVGSQELASAEARRTCKHWGAAAGIISSETIDLETDGTVKDAAKSLAKDAIKLRIFDKKNPFQTTIKYKCYQ